MDFAPSIFTFNTLYTNQKRPKQKLYPYTSSLSSVRCRVVRCCAGFHDSSPSHPILCCSHNILQCHPCIPEFLKSLSHDVGGRPLFLFPWTFPVMIVLSSPFLRITCPKKRNFRLRTISRSMSLFPILSKSI